MALLNLRNHVVTFLLLAIFLVLAVPRNVEGQNSVADIVTPEFFNGIKNQAPANCAGKSFYTRDAFLNALNSYPEFGRADSTDNSKREIAAFFANIAHETTNFCYVEEIKKSDPYCTPNLPQYPCAAGKFYYGRGPIQLTGNGNYIDAGKAIGFDGLNSPETVAKDPVISFKTALWYWMTYVHSVVNQGFGATIQKINGPAECKGKEPAQVESRVRSYTNFCSKFGVAPGPNLSC
ncbi:Chitinase [Melia azedarach]|uniref:Chitinase n=1 Tax=Melia azedarach TaxID=155640 RepID=A0ACC1YKT9_MELAZ|nr:Chitinase [Melia azedarach]